MSEIAKEYKARFVFEYNFESADLLDGVVTRAEVYDYIRETVAQSILELGFEWFEEIHDGVEIVESKEKEVF